jgi:hypothetical protein
VVLSKKISFKNFELQICDDSYYEVTVKPDSEFCISDLKKLVTTQVELGAQRLPVLVICAESATTNNELLKAISKNSNNPFSKADAFVISSMSQKILANFYIKINTPERPTKFFNSIEDALNWLKPFI